MTHLRIVPDGPFDPLTDFSRRVQPAIENARILEALTWKVLFPADQGAAELRAAIESGDPARSVPALRRLVAVGELARAHADRIVEGAA